MTKKVLSNLLLDPTNEVDDEDEFWNNKDNLYLTCTIYFFLKSWFFYLIYSYLLFNNYKFQIIIILIIIK